MCTWEPFALVSVQEMTMEKVNNEKGAMKSSLDINIWSTVVLRKSTYWYLQIFHPKDLGTWALGRESIFRVSTICTFS